VRGLLSPASRRSRRLTASSTIPPEATADQRDAVQELGGRSCEATRYRGQLHQKMRLPQTRRRNRGTASSATRRANPRGPTAAGVRATTSTQDEKRSTEQSQVRSSGSGRGSRLSLGRKPVIRRAGVVAVAGRWPSKEGSPKRQVFGNALRSRGAIRQTTKSEDTCRAGR